MNPPTEQDGPPSGVLALRFVNPTVIAFLTSPDAELPADWRTALHEDRIGPFGVNHDAFTLQSEERFRDAIADYKSECILGTEADLMSDAAPVKSAFRAESVGLAIRAQKLTLISSSGEISQEQIHQASEKWWSYWREYWNRRDTDAPLPKDYACEVTIPLA